MSTGNVQPFIPLRSIKPVGPLVATGGTVTPGTLVDGKTNASNGPHRARVLRPNDLGRDRIAYTVRAHVTIATSRVGAGFLTEVALWDGHAHFGGWTVVSAVATERLARSAHASTVALFRTDDKAVSSR